MIDSDDKPFYAPVRKLCPAPGGSPPTEAVWSLRRDGVEWSCELLFRGESYGWEARVLNQGERIVSQRFILKDPAVRLADEQKTDIERGWVD